jgi:hypothetical protein
MPRARNASVGWTRNVRERLVPPSVEKPVSTTIVRSPVSTTQK